MMMNDLKKINNSNINNQKYIMNSGESMAGVNSMDSKSKFSFSSNTNNIIVFKGLYIDILIHMVWAFTFGICILYPTKYAGKQCPNNVLFISTMIFYFHLAGFIINFCWIGFTYCGENCFNRRLYQACSLFFFFIFRLGFAILGLVLIIILMGLYYESKFCEILGLLNNIYLIVFFLLVTLCCLFLCCWIIAKYQYSNNNFSEDDEYQSEYSMSQQQNQQQQFEDEEEDDDQGGGGGGGGGGSSISFNAHKKQKFNMK